MTTTISGDTGINKVQDGSVGQADLATNVVGNGPAFRMTGGATSVASAIQSRLQLSVVDHDTASGCDTAAKVYYIKASGYYSFSAQMTLNGSAAGNPYSSIGIAKNGTTLISKEFANHASLALTFDVTLASVYCGIGEYIEVIGSQNSGVTITSPACSLSGALVRAA